MIDFLSNVSIDSHHLSIYLEFGTQTLPVLSLDTDTKAPSGKKAAASPLTSISCPGIEQLNLYVLCEAILFNRTAQWLNLQQMFKAKATQTRNWHSNSTAEEVAEMPVWCTMGKQRMKNNDN